MKFGIVGLSLTHPYTFADILTKNGHRISYVWDENMDKARKYADKYNAESVNSFEEISFKEVDGVFVECQSYLHCSIAKVFIKKRIPVFIDKVMSLHVNELHETLKMAKEYDSVLMSCSAIRYMPQYIKLKKDIKSGMLGSVVAVSADVTHDMAGYLIPSNTWQDDPKTSGGEIMNFGIHGVEPVYCMLGPGVQWVQCNKNKAVYDCAKSEDMAFISIGFNNGTTGIVSLISCVSDYGFSMKAYGTKNIMEAGEKSYNGTNIDDQYGYERMIFEFIHGIENNEPPIPYNEIEEIVKVMIAARISADENRVVHIEELTDNALE